MKTKLASLGVLLASALFGASLASANDAVTYQINPQHTGAAQFQPSLALPLRQTWRRIFAGNVGYPLITQSAVFVSVVDPTAGSVVHALNPTTGATLWSAPIPTTYGITGIAYDAGLVFAVNYSGVVTALRASNGQQAWRTTMAGQYMFNSPPSARDGTLYLLGAGSGATLYAVREVNGAPLWSQALPAGDTSSPTLSEDGVFVSAPCLVYEFDAATGAQRWVSNGGCTGGGGVTASLYDQLLFTSQVDLNNPGAGYALLAFNGKKIGALGKLDNSSAYVNKVGFSFPPALQAGRGYLVNDTNKLVALSIPSLTQSWSFSGGGGAALAPIVVDGHVIALTQTGNLYVLNSATGAVEQTLPMAASAPGSFSVPTGLAAGHEMIAVPYHNSLTAFRGK